MRRLLLPGLVLLTILLPAFATTPARAAERELRLVNFGEINTLDPQKMTWLEDIRIAQCLFEPLVLYKLPEGTFEGGAAATWEVSPDGRTYTFHLRPEAKWSNGDPLTAGDFIYAWRRALLPDLAVDYTQLFFAIAGAEDFFNYRSRQLKDFAGKSWPDEAAARSAAEEAWRQAQERFTQTVGLSAPDPRTLVVKLARPTPYFLHLTAFATFMPVHARAVDALVSLSPHTGMLTQDVNWTRPDKLICNGPYTLERWRPKRDLRVTANPYYWNRGAMGNDAILQLYFPDLQTGLLAYQRGEADWIPDPPTSKAVTAQLANSGRKDVHIQPMAGTYFYNFNCHATLTDGRPNPLADARVRRALALAVDREMVVKSITRLNQPVAKSFVPPQVIPGYAPPLDAAAGDFDPATARKLLAEAGYPGGKGLTGLSILYNTEGGHESVAQFIRQAWEKHLGVAVTLEGVEKKTFGARLRKHEFTICRASWIGDYPDPTTFLDKFQSDNGNNDAQYRDPEYDRLLARASETSNPTARAQLLQQAERRMLTAQPILPLYHYVFVELYDPKRVTGLKPNPWNFRRLELVGVAR